MMKKILIEPTFNFSALFVFWLFFSFVCDFLELSSRWSLAPSKKLARNKFKHNLKENKTVREVETQNN